MPKPVVSQLGWLYIPIPPTIITTLPNTVWEHIFPLKNIATSQGQTVIISSYGMVHRWQSCFLSTIGWFNHHSLWVNYGKSPCFMCKSPFVLGKSSCFMGKSPFFLGLKFHQFEKNPGRVFAASFHHSTCLDRGPSCGLWGERSLPCF